MFQISPRFGIREQHGTHDPAFRVIDDLERPKLNQTLEQADAYCPDAIDRFFALTRRAGRYAGKQILGCPRASIKHIKYRIGRRLNAECSWCVTHPSDESVYLLRLRGQPFSSYRPPANCGMVATFPQHIALLEFEVPSGCF